MFVRRLPTVLEHLQRSISLFSSRPLTTPPFCRPRALTIAHARRHSSFGVYNLAVVREIPSSLPEHALRQNSDRKNRVNLQNAIKQHEEYKKVLEEVGLEVISIPADHQYPDCVFIEDTAVVTDGTAVITIPGHESRRGETVAVRDVLEKIPGLSVVEMVDPARMDGGDVLFTGQEFIVGLSQRTNNEGVAQLAAAFPNYTVLPVKVMQGLHLKSFMTMIGDGVIGIGPSEGAKLARQQIYSSSQFDYKFVEFPSDTAAHCLFINGNLVHVPGDISTDSTDIFNSLSVTGRKIPVDVSELRKVDGNFTCSSLLIHANQT